MGQTMELATIVCIMSSLLGVVCRRTAVIKPHRDVSTTQGTVRGYLTPTHAAYFGIPYARSPTQGDRFKAPEPPPTWDGVFEASHKIKCPQPDEDGEENCLVLNVFAPRHVKPLPVYVILHDGDLNSGWGTYEPPELLLKEGFVVVTFNYRLGALGFLCLSIPDALGNAGLKDQIAALYWVHRNIEQFGGNPNQVIVHGAGSAAVSIQLLLLSGLVDELIHKVIIESGSVLSPLSMTYDPVSIAYQGAIAIGYGGSDDVEEMYQFYEQAPLEDLVNIPTSFVPCVEEKIHSHSLINFDPRHKLKEGHGHKVPIMITYTDTNDVSNVTDFDKPPETMTELLPSNLEFDNGDIKEKIGQIVKEFYFGNDIFNTEDVEQVYFEYNFDVIVEYPVVDWAMLYAGNGTHMVYLLKFIQDSESASDDSIIGSGTILDNLYKDDEDIVLEKLLTLWRNFIKIGDPTPLTTTLIPVIWQPVVTDKRNAKAIATIPTLHFGENTLKVSPPPKNQKLLFWDNIYNRFYRAHIIIQDKSGDLDDND